MVDTFLFLTLARTGDQLQGIKKRHPRAGRRDRGEQGRRPARATSPRGPPASWPARCGCCGRADDGWPTPVLTCSALTGNGLDEVWALVERHQRMLERQRRARPPPPRPAGQLDVVAGQGPAAGPAARQRRAQRARTAAGGGRQGRHHHPRPGRPAPGRRVPARPNLDDITGRSTTSSPCGPLPPKPAAADRPLGPPTATLGDGASGPGRPGLILDLQQRPLAEYRGDTEIGRYSWLAWEGDTAVGYTGCDT